MINKAKLLMELYNAAKPFGMSFLAYTPDQMTYQEAQDLINSGKTYFDYYNGRLIKVDLNRLDGRLWDRDYGDGSFDSILAKCHE